MLIQVKDQAAGGLFCGDKAGILQKLLAAALVRETGMDIQISLVGMS